MEPHVVFEFTITSASEGERRVAFPSERFSIGTAPDAGIRLASPALRPRHVELDATGPLPRMRALNSTGFRLAGVKVMEAELREGSIIELGEFELRLSRRASAPPAKGMRTPARSRKEPLPSLITEDDTACAATSQREALSDDTVNSNPLGAGSLVADRYRITARLAAGGMGEVYKAEHIELKKPVAIKVMLPALSMDPDFVTRFKLEATSASRIGQQNIIDVIDFGRLDDGRFFFVMEFIEGKTLTELIRVNPPIALKRAISIASQMSRALAAAHSAGIVHRDLKPENIMVSQRPGHPDFVKVLDFGVAKIPESMGAGGHTQVGMVVGTPQYMSPEQAKTIPVTTASDVYSLGLIFYEMLSGIAAFEGETASILMMKQVYEAPPSFTPELAASTPESLCTLIFRMLEKEPERRPASMDEVVEVLEQAHFDQQLDQRMRQLGTPLPGALQSTATPVPMRQPRASKSILETQPIVDHEAPIELPKSKAPRIVAIALGLIGLAVVGWLATRPVEIETPRPMPVIEPIVEVKPVEAAPLVIPPMPSAEPTAPPPSPTIVETPKKATAPIKKKARATDLKDPFGE